MRVAKRALTCRKRGLSPGSTGPDISHDPAGFPESRRASRRLIGKLESGPRLVALVLYGSGLRVLEVLQLRVKDLDLETGEICVRRAKGGRDRVTMLARAAMPLLRDHLARRQRLLRACS